MLEYRVFVRDLDNHFLSTGFTFIYPLNQPQGLSALRPVTAEPLESAAPKFQ
jgi:hypothetical protein